MVSILKVSTQKGCTKTYEKDLKVWGEKEEVTAYCVLSSQLYNAD